jgi:hypothetical protein
MDLTPYVDSLRRELTIAAEVGGDEARALADRLLQPLDAAVRLTLLEALSTATEEISADLAPGAVDVRLRSGAAEFVVTAPPAGQDATATTGPVDVRLTGGEDDDAMVRINLRLPGSLKALIEDAAAGGGISVNSWLVRAAVAGLAGEGRTQAGTAMPKPGQVGQTYRGWAR